MDKPRRLVVIDDDPEIGKIVTDAANLFGIPACATCDPGEFMARVESDQPEFAVLDLQMPEVVCAEGIERSEHLAVVMAAGCEMGQGYLFSKPVPSARLPTEVDFFSDKPRSALGGG